MNATAGPAMKSQRRAVTPIASISFLVASGELRSGQSALWTSINRTSPSVWCHDECGGNWATDGSLWITPSEHQSEGRRGEQRRGDSGEVRATVILRVRFRRRSFWLRALQAGVEQRASPPDTYVHLPGEHQRCGLGVSGCGRRDDGTCPGVGTGAFGSSPGAGARGRRRS